MALASVPTSSDFLGAWSAGTNSPLLVIVAALAMALSGSPASGAAGPVPGSDWSAFATAVSAVADDRRVGEHALPTEPTVVAAVGTAERAANQALAFALPDDNGAADPETMRVSSFTASPRYDDDHTIFMAGEPLVDAPGASAPLAASRDGGSSWQALPAVGLAPVVRLLFPPAYPEDGRIFAFTRKGLQVSRDDGGSFETLVAMPNMPVYSVPNVTGVAMSPRFNTGDPSVLLVANSTLWEYRADTGLVEPIVLPPALARHWVTSVAYAADDAAAQTVLLGTAAGAASIVGGGHGLHVSRCTRQRLLGGAGGLHLACDAAPFAMSGFDMLQFRMPPVQGSNVVYAPSTFQPFVSLDGGRTFRAARPASDARGDDHYMVNDLFPVPSPRGESAIVAQKTWPIPGGELVYGPQLARTDDAGHTWTSHFIDLPKFEMATRVVVTPTGRIVAASGEGGIACSEDGGRTWARTCPTPDTA